MITEKEFDDIAQRAHLLFGIVVVLVPSYLWSPKYAWAYGTLLLIWAVWKEAYYDVYYEREEVRQSGLRDFVYYLIGVAIGWGITYFG